MELQRGTNIRNHTVNKKRASRKSSSINIYIWRTVETKIGKNYKKIKTDDLDAGSTLGDFV